MSDTVTLQLHRGKNEPWGIEIAGDAPVKIKTVRAGTPADSAGVQEGDVVIAINGQNVCNSRHKEVIELVKNSGNVLRLKLLPKEEFMSDSESESEVELMSQKTKASMYKSKSSVKSNWWEGDETPEETEQEEEEEEVEFNPDFQVDEDEEAAKLKEIEDKMKSLKSKRSLAELLEEDKTRKLIKAEHEEKFFISTADQRNYDDAIKANKGLDDHGDGSFVGRKACIPGCFSGDNVIVEDRWEGGYRKGNEVTGIRNRVRAGIQHYEYDLYAMYAAEEDRNKVVIYTTTLGVDKKLVADCDRATTIIRNMKVRWEERDIFNFEEHKDEFLVRKGLKPGASLSEHLPAIYIDGQFIGRLDELQSLADCGDLRVRLAEFDKLYERHKCPDCQGTGKLVCPDCKGKKVKKRNRFGKLRCGECDVNAQVDCKGCYLPSEILRV